MSWTLKGKRADHAAAAPVSAVNEKDLAFVQRQPAEVVVAPKAAPKATPKAPAAPAQGKGKGRGRGKGKEGKTAARKGLKRPAAASNMVAPADELPTIAAAVREGGAADDVSDHVSLPSPSTPEASFTPADAPKPPTAYSASAGAPPRTAVAAPEVAAQAKARKHLGRLPFPEGAREKIHNLGHSKCRSRGCPDCRQRVGLILNENQSAWIWDPNRS